jgi:hypothetical protein
MGGEIGWKRSNRYNKLSPLGTIYPPTTTNSIVAMKEESIIEKARYLFYHKTLVKYRERDIGAVAAIPLRNGQDLNYGEIFLRDNVPVMIFLLLENRGDTVRYFLDTCLELQSKSFQTEGIFPTSFVEIHGEIKIDYGQRAIGRVCSIDATLWWAILAYIYVNWTKDYDWAIKPEVQLGLEKFLNLILHPSFRDAPTLYVPDGAFMIDRPLDVWGSPLEIQVLLYGALKSAAGLLSIDLEKSQQLAENSETSTTNIQKKIDNLNYTIRWIERLRTYLLKHYWINSNIVQTLRRRPTEQYGEIVLNEHNIQTETIPNWLQEWLGRDGGYLIGNIRTGRPDFRFFSLGNCLGAIFDTISPMQMRFLFRLILRNQNALIAQMPLRICHPPLDDVDWRKKTGYDRKNLPWSYHNGGHWPCLFWFLVVAILHHRQISSRSTVEEYELDALMQKTYDLLLQRLPKQKWAEYFDGPTGVWIGQQARSYQTWTIVGLLLANHFLNYPEDSKIMSLPTLQKLHELKKNLDFNHI